MKNGEQLTTLYLKSVVILLADVFEKIIKVSKNEFNINPLYCVTLLGYTYDCGLNYTDIKLQTLQDKYMILLIENNIRGGISSVMGDRYVITDENEKIIYIDATNLYGHSMFEPLPFDESKLDINVKLEDILTTPVDSDIGYFVEVDLKYPDEIREKTESFPFFPENKISPKDKFSKHMNDIKLDNYTQNKKFICDWTDEKKYLIHYGMLKFYVRHGIRVEKVKKLFCLKRVGGWKNISVLILKNEKGLKKNWKRLL